MSYRSAVVTKATILVWRTPEVGDLAPFIALLKETRAIARAPVAFFSVSPPEIVPPGTDFLSAVRPLMDQILELAPHAAVVIEGGGLQQAFVRTFHSMLFTMTRRNVAVFRTLPDAAQRLAPSLGLHPENWIAEMRAHPVLASRFPDSAERRARAS